MIDVVLAVQSLLFVMVIFSFCSFSFHSLVLELRAVFVFRNLMKPSNDTPTNALPKIHSLFQSSLTSTTLSLPSSNKNHPHRERVESNLVKMMKLRIFTSIAINLCYLFNGIFGFVIIKQQPKFSILSSSKGDGDQNDDRKSVGDEILRAEWAADLAASGGDPYFLPDGFDEEDDWYSDSASGDNGEEIESPSLSLLSMASMPSVVGDLIGDKEGDGGDEVESSDDDADFEWDGIENEDAYYD